ncbi:MAG: extracellular solute-binding protein, partial [Actinomycetota bacterium]|nr:extracellular solute-binding protein [Actinomycetota bacterium]
MSSTKRRMRSIAGVLIAGALLVGASACATGDGGGNAAPESIGPEGVDDGSTLTLWTRAPLEKQAKLLVEAYNESHENQVELTVVPNDDYVAKVGAAAGSGGLPDLFAADIVYVPNWVEQGLFQDITSQIDGLDFKDEINKGHLSAGTVDGKEHVLPFVLDLSMMFWNKELFAEAGLDPEVAPANLQEFADAAKAIQALNKPDTYGTATGLNCGGCLVFTWFPSVWADGEEVLSDDGMESMLASDTAKDIYSTWKDLWDSGAVLPSSQDEAGPTWTAGFTEGKVGLMFYPATLLSSTPFDAGVAGIPGPEGG